MRFPFPTRALGALVLLACTLGAAPRVLDEVPYEELATRFLKEHGVESASPDDFDAEAFTTQHFLQLDLGLYRAQTPWSDVAEKDAVERLIEAWTALILAQEQWLEWLQAGGAEVEPVLADAQAIAKWLEGLKAKRVAERVVRRSSDSPDVLETDEETGAALERFAASMRSGTGLEAGRQSAAPSLLVLLPGRTDFVEYVCFAGWLHASHRSAYWAEGMPTWTHCRIGNEALAMALQYAEPGAPWEEGMSMNDRTPTGLRQQVAQLAAQQLLDNYFGARMPAAFANGLAMNLVIDEWDEVNTRVDGDLSGNRTAAIESFVRGGQSEGGVLGVNRADSRWRADNGKYRFVRVLRKAQKDGYDANRRDAESRVSSFLMLAGPGDEGRVVEAPFLGGGKTSKLPDKYQGDFAEFMRSYGCAFSYWLKSEAGGRAKEAPERFLTFLRALVQPAQPAFAELLETTYGEPLSHPESLESPSLEREFLDWIAKQKASR